MIQASYHREQDPGDENHFIVYVPKSEMAWVDALPDLISRANSLLKAMKDSDELVPLSVAIRGSELNTILASTEIATQEATNA